jgi:hypothetical protein
MFAIISRLRAANRPLRAFEPPPEDTPEDGSPATELQPYD